jgi:hypothetical protein
MKKILRTFAAIGAALSLLTGCSTINSLTPAQITQIGSAITQVADQGAVYAINHGTNYATDFIAADTVLDNFANGTDLSPAALTTALSSITGTNQWVNLAVAAVITAYDYSYSQYVSTQLTNLPAAKVWILDAEAGFKQALASTGFGLKVQAPPDFIVNGKVDKAVINARIEAAAKK